jgi:hypothetical protein
VIPPGGVGLFTNTNVERRNDPTAKVAIPTKKIKTLFSLLDFIRVIPSGF